MSDISESDAKIQAYLREFSRLVLLTPGTNDFEIEQTSLNTLWENLTVEEQAVAHEKASPFREKLTK